MAQIEGETLLESLGYKQELNRAVSTLGTIGLVVSDITPTASLLVIGPVVIATAGSGSLWAYFIGCFIAIAVALCMGELGSMFPVAGGLYSIVVKGEGSSFTPYTYTLLPSVARSDSAGQLVAWDALNSLQLDGPLCRAL